MTSPLVYEKIWLDKNKYDEAERQYFEKLAKLANNGIIKPNTIHTFISQSNKGGGKSPVKITPIATKDPAKHTNKQDINMSNLHSNKKLALLDLTSSNPDVTEITIAPANPIAPLPVGLSEKRFKPKDAKDKRNKADKKGREKRITSKEETKGSPNTPSKNSLAGEVAKARQHIKNSLECMDNLATLTGNASVELVNKMNALEKENATFNKKLTSLLSTIEKLESRIKHLEGAGGSKSAALPKKQDDDDDGVDLFGSDSEEESEESKKLKEARVSAYAAKKSSKPVLIAKSNIILDVKPWDDETDMKELEKVVRKVSCDGLLWGASKLVPLAYGIHKLQISCVVEDEKVSIDWLQETIEAFEEYVQSVDIAAFNKV